MKFGDTINPALGRTDYTPYLQGAVSGAQSIGQGLQNLGVGIGKGMEKWAERKKENSQKEAAVKSGLKSLEAMKDIIAQLPEGAKQAYSSAMDDLHDPSKSLDERFATSQTIGKTLTEVLNLGYQAKENQMKMDEYNRLVGERNKAAATEAARNALILGKSVGAPYSPEVLNAANVATLEWSGKLAKEAKAPNEFQTFIEAKKTDWLAKNPSEKEVPASIAAGFVEDYRKLGRPTTNINTAKDPFAEVGAEVVKGRMQDERAKYEASIRAGEYASQIEKALNAGGKSGPMTSVFAPIAKYAEAAGLGDFKAMETTIAQKGLAGFAASQLSGMAKGLGSMSNADREFFTAAVPNINDPEKSTRYFVEMAKENARLAKEDAAFERKLQREGVQQDEIFRQLDERREGRSVAKSVYERVTGEKADMQTNATPSVVDRSAIEAELARRAAIKKGK